MIDKGFLLQWEDFDLSASNFFKALQSEKDFYDVTLGCTDSRGQLLRAHKVILASFSSVFKDMLKQDDPTQSNTRTSFLFRGIPHDDLAGILDFVYQGEVKMSEQDLPRFLSIAEDLKIRGLCNNRLPIEEKSSSELIKTTNRFASSYYNDSKHEKVQLNNVDGRKSVSDHSDLLEIDEFKQESIQGKDHPDTLSSNRYKTKYLALNDINAKMEEATNQRADNTSDNLNENIRSSKSLIHQIVNIDKREPGSAPRRTRKGKRSSVWNFFKKHVTEKSVVCNVCARHVKHGKVGSQEYGTTGMWKHLRCCHADEYSVAMSMKMNSG